MNCYFSPFRSTFIRTVYFLCVALCIFRVGNCEEAIIRIKYSKLPSRATVRLDGESLGRIDDEFEPDKDVDYKEMTIKNLDDTPHTQFKLLTLDFEDDRSDDFHVFIPVTVGEANPRPIEISLSEIAPLSFYFRRTIFESAPHLVAGDKVSMFANDAADKYERLIWLAVPSVQEKGEEGSESEVSSVVMEEHDYGAFLLIRKIIRRQLAGLADRGGNGLMFSQKADFRINYVMGTGATAEWLPEYEGQVRIYLIGQTKGDDPRWMVVSRLFNIVDIRPTVWLRPQLVSRTNVDEMAALTREATRINRFSPIQHSYLIFRAFAEMEFQAEEGSEIQFDVMQGPFLNAEVPVDSLVVAVDGESVALETDATLFRHTFNTPGLRIMDFTVKDVHGLTRTQRIQVNVLPKSIAAGKRREALDKIHEYSGDSFWLVNLAMLEWAEKVTAMDSWKNVPAGAKVAISHPDNLPDQLEVNLNGVHRDVGDLVDFHLVEALRRRGTPVVERDEGWVTAARGAVGDEGPLPGPDVLLLYKLKQAVVEVDTTGPVSFRRANILAMVRVLDPETFEVLENRMIDASASDFTVDVNYGARDLRAVDRYADGFLQTIRRVKSATGSGDMSSVGLTREEYERSEERRDKKSSSTR